ncbi:hypothetical protein HDV62DRAFT_369840 [Trichoderma sp. SZMC 28011]
MRKTNSLLPLLALNCTGMLGIGPSLWPATITYSNSADSCAPVLSLRTTQLVSLHQQLTRTSHGVRVLNHVLKPRIKCWFRGGVGSGVLVDIVMARIQTSA